LNKLVSILIPNYNKAPFLKETLDSILNQTYTKWECIVVDDHSTDDSWGILQEYAKKDGRFQVLRRPKNLPKGGNASRNYAFKISKGAYINWFDSDDIMFDNFIEVKVRQLELLDVDAVVSRLLCFENDVKDSFYIEWIPEFQNLRIDYLIKDIHFSTPGPLFKKSFLEGKKLFNKRIKIGQEKEFFFRLLLSGMRVHVLEEKLMYYRMLQNSKARWYPKNNMQVETNYQYLLISKSLLLKGRLPMELKIFVLKKLKRFFGYMIKEKNFKYLPEWLFTAVLFIIRFERSKKMVKSV